MQIHFATFRNTNTNLFNSIGRDSGFDVIRHETHSDRLAKFLDDLNNIENNLGKSFTVSKLAVL